MDPSEGRQLWWPSLLPIVPSSFNAFSDTGRVSSCLPAGAFSAGMTVRVAHRSHIARTTARGSLI